MAGISLIVRADDFGVCHTSNQAVVEAFETGVLTCASLVAAGPWLAEAAGLVHAYPEWEIGLQLGLCCRALGCRWGPVAGAAAVPGLVDAAGCFPPQLPATLPADEVLREFTAQVERARTWGVAPAYLEVDGDVTPEVAAALHRLSEDLGVPARMDTWGVQRLSLPPAADRPRHAALGDLLPALPDGVYLWVVRPTYDSPETSALWGDPDTLREGQADALAVRSPEVRDLLAARGIELISFGQHVEQRLGTEAQRE